MNTCQAAAPTQAAPARTADVNPWTQRSKPATEDARIKEWPSLPTQGVGVGVESGPPRDSDATTGNTIVSATQVTNEAREAKTSTTQVSLNNGM